jgi:hypothetical protein
MEDYNDELKNFQDLVEFLCATGHFNYQYHGYTSSANP